MILAVSTLAFALALQFATSFHANAAETRVIDGDSLVYEGRTLEIWGIIAPSLGETCVTRNNEKWRCGERAFEALSQAASDASFACAEEEPGFVVCTAGGLDVGLLMVKEGLVRSRQDYKGAEARAREAGIGLWE